MPRKKPEEPIAVKRNEPLQCCYDCIYWHRNQNPNDPDAVDFSSGLCDRNGYSKVPPLFSCNGWSDGNGKNL